VTHARSLQPDAAALPFVASSSHGRRCDGYCAKVATTRSRFPRLLGMTLACAVTLGACGSPRPSSTTTSTVSSATSVSTIVGQALRDRLAGRTFIFAKPDGTFPTHLLQPTGTLTFVLLGNESSNFIKGTNACNSVAYSGSLDGDHVVIAEAATTAVGCPYQGLSWFEPLDARLALSDDGSTITVTVSDTGQVAYLLFETARFPLAPTASLVGTYQLTAKRLLVLDADGTGRIVDATSHLVTCPITWTPPPAFSISRSGCPDDAELMSPLGMSLSATGEVRQHGSSLFVGSLAFTKTTPAPAPPPTPNLMANWPARPDRTFTMADVPVLLPPGREGSYRLFDGFVSSPDSSTSTSVGDQFVQYLVNAADPADLVVVDTALGRASLDQIGDPITVKGWPGAWSANGTLTLLSDTGRVTLTGTNARQLADRLTRRVTGAGWDLAGYPPIFEGWRYPPMARSVQIDADDYKAYIRVKAGGSEVQAFELIGPKLEHVDVNGQPASLVESVGTWDVTWSPSPDVILTVSYTLPGENFDYEAFSALRPAAIAFARSLQIATPEELDALVAR
jgi:hypothetical protein